MKKPPFFHEFSLKNRNISAFRGKTRGFALDNPWIIHYNGQAIGVWRSLVSRMVRVHEAAGSNPATPTMGKSFQGLPIFHLFFLKLHICVQLFAVFSLFVEEHSSYYLKRRGYQCTINEVQVYCWFIRQQSRHNELLMRVNYGWFGEQPSLQLLVYIVHPWTAESYLLTIR